MTNYIYNKVKDGFLKVEHTKRKRHRGFRGFDPVKTVFDCWGPAGSGELYVFSDDQINDIAHVREVLKKLVPNLVMSELIVVPTEEGMGGHAPDFFHSYSLLEHITKLELYLP